MIFERRGTKESRSREPSKFLREYGDEEDIWTAAVEGVDGEL